MSDFARALMSRIVELERRIGGMKFRGKVTDVDPEKWKIKIEIGEDEDGNPVKSPWVDVQQRAGALKLHSLPSVGELWELDCDAGDIQQAKAVPFHWTDDNPSPSQKGDEHVLTFGDVTITLTSDGLKMAVGGVAYSWTGSGFEQTGGTQKHDGVVTDKTHTHDDVVMGSDTTGKVTA